MVELVLYCVFGCIGGFFCVIEWFVGFVIG